MTKREAIRECKRMWKEIVKSGLSKYGFLSTQAGEKWRDKGYRVDCPLCQYAWVSSHGNCNSCPLKVQYGRFCISLDYETDPKGFYEYVKGLKE